MAIVLLIGLALYTCAQFPSLRSGEALLLTFVFPVATGVWAMIAVRDAAPRRAAIGALLILATGVLAEWELAQFVTPGAPDATARVSEQVTDAVLRGPHGSKPMLVRVRGTVPDGSASSLARFSLSLRRGNTRRTIRGRLGMEVHTSGRAATPPSTTVLSSHDARLELPGSGNIHAHLDDVDSDLDELDISAWSIPDADGPPLWVFGTLLLLGALVQAWIARERIRAHLAVVIAANAAFAYHTAEHFNPNDPIITVLGGLVFASIAGFLGGSFLAALARWLLVREPAR